MRFWIFGWFLFIFGLMATLFIGAVGGLIYLAVNSVAGTETPPTLFLLVSCGLTLLFPAVLFSLGRRAFRSIATPLADVMAAADKVAAGDFTVRITNDGRRHQFTPLIKAFNNMTVELQKADEQRRNLTADVAHELRTPLHIIQGNLEGIIDGVYAPTSEHLEATLEETHTLSRLVDDLHTLAQAEAGQLPLQMAPVDVSELLADVQTGFGGQASVKEIDLAVTIQDKPAALTIEGDAGRLDQVLSNLVANALRHTKAGGSVSLKAARQNGRVHIQVSDTGEGIPPQDLPYIFSRFWRGDRSRTRGDGAGGGLGLAITKQLVEAHQGRIEVESTVGRGTTFTIQLPLQQSSAAARP